MKRLGRVLRLAGLVWLLKVQLVVAAEVLIPMDNAQTDHLKAYGIAYWELTQGARVDWLLNYRGGSFLCEVAPGLEERCLLRGVRYEAVDAAGVAAIHATIEQENMELIRLEKVPKVAIYTPPTKEPWDDAVTLALTYADIPYSTVWDAEVLAGKLSDYDWLHLHHEDFTGQFGKFYAAYRNALWYRQEKQANEEMARALGFKKVSESKRAVALATRDFVEQGGYLFAMCSAPETIDIALAAQQTDIVPAEFDGDPPDADCQARLDYAQTFAFTDFTVSLDPMAYEHSDIDTSPDRMLKVADRGLDFFTLFEFSAKLDPVPSMLVQDHVNAVNGFMGQTTAFRKSLVKSRVITLAESPALGEVRYLHGNFGRGTFTFYGGHDPEDYQHMVGDPPTNLEFHKNSPGYRLILNNILFPAARKKERKT
jgi:hypothetical protein